MIKHKKYEKYKDSGVDIMGEVPERWSIGSLRWYISCKSGDFINTIDVERDKTEDKAIPVIGGNGVMGYCDKYNVKNKTIAIGRVGALCGNVHLIDYLCWITDNSLMINYLDNKLDIGYLALVLQSLNLNRFSTSTAQPLITGETIKKRKICIPTIEEQIRIYKFINEKTSEIDSIITDKEKLITLLEEKRQAIITEAITKGLNTNVRMKDSGVEWIGDIPEHWRLKKLKYIGEAIIGLTYSPNDISDGTGTLVLRSSNVQNNEIVFNDNVYVDSSIEIRDKLRTKEGDILICSRNGSRALIGKNAYINKENEGFSFGAFMTVFRSRYNNYLRYVFNSTLFKNQSGSFLTSTINQLTINNLYSFLIPMPSMDEQILISDYLERKIVEIDNLRADIKIQIEKLKEYRQSLISEAVTGKIDVRDYCKEA